MKKHLVLAAALLAAGCTYTMGDNLMDAQFHMPFTSQQWEMEKSTTNGHKVCALNSGYGGLTIAMQRSGITVTSNHPMDPGTTLTVTTSNGGRFETSDMAFSPDAAKEMVEHFRQGGKAYMEWSEVHLVAGATRLRTTQIVSLDNFAAQMDACEHSLHHK